MSVTTEPEALAAVEPCDREAAADTLFHVDGDPFVEHIREGFEDESYLVQAFARHRIAALSTPAARMLAGEGDVMARQMLAGRGRFPSGGSVPFDVAEELIIAALAHPPAADPVGLREALAKADEVAAQSHRFRNGEMGWIIPDDEWQELREAILATPARTDDAGVGGEVERLTHVIDRDRYVAAACVNAIDIALNRRSWLSEAGRGSYEYDDDRYQQEFGSALAEIEEALRPMRALAKDKTDCTRDEERVKAARAEGAQKFATLSPAPDRGEVGNLVAKIISAIEAEQERLSKEDYLLDSRDCIDVIRETVAALKPADATPAGEAVQMAETEISYDVWDNRTQGRGSGE